MGSGVVAFSLIRPTLWEDFSRLAPLAAQGSAIIGEYGPGVAGSVGSGQFGRSREGAAHRGLLTAGAGLADTPPGDM